MTAFLLSLAVVVVLIAGGIIFQFFRYRSRYAKLGLALCDSGTSRVTFALRTMVLKGKIDGTVMAYTVFGDERAGHPVGAYLLVEAPVKANLRMYETSDLRGLPPALAGPLGMIQETPDFRALILTSETTPFPARLLSRPLGFGYRPGLLLWRFVTAPFSADQVRKDFDLLVSAVKQGI